MSALTVKMLRDALSQYPDEATVEAYEGEGIGLRIIHGELTSWIDCFDQTQNSPLEE